MAEQGWTLKSGGAEGADTAFEEGASGSHDSAAEIFRWEKGVRNQWARTMVQQVINRLNQENGENIPPLSKMRERVAGLLARNMEIMKDCKFVVAWTPEGKMVGGTRYALKYAEMFNISIYNYGVMADADIRKAIRENHGVEVW